MALFGGKDPGQLTLTEAIMVGFRMVLQPNFIIPILIIGVVINIVVIAAIVPIVLGLVLGGTTGSGAAIGGAIVAGILGAVIAAIVGGLLLNLYGQVWATMASVGEAPTISAAFTRVGERWVGILGAGLITGSVTLAIIIVGGIVAAILGALGALILIVAVLAAIYIGARLSLSGWLAADGAAAVDAVKTSWAMTQGRLLLIVGWGLAFALVFGIVGAVVSAVLGIVPIVGPALAQAIVSAFGFGAGVSLYRKVKAA
ncbi:MAG: hypothetical protein HYX54_06040 [Chloroflexi bacterium]|nr:hypothetical protein [Chloroflexota bacterium]